MLREYVRPQHDVDAAPRPQGPTLSLTVLLTGPGELRSEEGRVLVKGDGQVRLLVLLDVEAGDVLSEEDVFGSTGASDDYRAAMLEYWGL